MPDRFRPTLPTAQQPSVAEMNRQIDANRAKRRLSAIIASRPPGQGSTATTPYLPPNVPADWFGRPEDASRATLDRANQFSQSSGLDRAEADNAAMAAQTRAEGQSHNPVPGMVETAAGVPGAALGGLTGLLHAALHKPELGDEDPGAITVGDLRQAGFKGVGKAFEQGLADPHTMANAAGNLVDLAAPEVLGDTLGAVPGAMEATGRGMQKVGNATANFGVRASQKPFLGMTFPGAGLAEAVLRSDPKGLAVAAAPSLIKAGGKALSAVGRGVEGTPGAVSAGMEGLKQMISPVEPPAVPPTPPEWWNGPMATEVPYRNTTPARDFMDEADFIRDMTTTPTGPSTGRPQYITQQAPSTFSQGAAMKASGLKPNSPAWAAMEHLLEPGDPMGPTNTPQEVAASARTSPSLASVQERARGTSIAPTENAWSSLAKLARGESEAPPWSPAAETLGEQDPQFTPMGAEDYFNTGRGRQTPVAVSGGGLDLSTSPGGTTHSLGADELAGMSDEAFKRAVSKPADAPDFSGLSDLDRAARLAALQRLMGS